MNKKHFIFWVGLLGLGATCTLSPIVSASLTTTVEWVKTHFSQSREITEEQKAEMIARHQEMLGKQLEEGKITQEQFNEMTTNLENGEFFTVTVRRDFRWEKTLERVELTDEQKAEMLTRHQAMLEKQLEEGYITQEQFDEIVTNLENGTFPIMGMHFQGKGQFERVELTEEQKVEMAVKIENGDFPMIKEKKEPHQRGRGTHNTFPSTLE